MFGIGRLLGRVQRPEEPCQEQTLDEASRCAPHTLGLNKTRAAIPIMVVFD